jgi:hypothetical protein
MTALAAPLPRRLTLPRLEPILGTTGLALLASLALTLPALWLDPRLFQDESVWLKPVKFQIALVIWFLTLAWFATFLPQRVLARPALRFWFRLAALGTLAEMLWIGGAAMFSTASHYNPDGVMAAIYPLMGLVAVQLTSVSLVIGLALARDPAPALPRPVHLSVWLGLVLTFALTLPAAFILAGNPGHFVGEPLTGAAVPLMGWSREVGDLRVGHFLATHALHALPLAGLVAARVWPAGTGARAVWGAGALYGALTLAAIVQALAGRPLIPLG